ncbi:MAG: flagellar hook-associated protein FlgK [Candidatus Lambdaproteobacteria bacterium]|nr:flagellar hook-associated protein FlgK [Candidatus Lambdaproteobacteria bacterium]
MSTSNLFGQLSMGKRSLTAQQAGMNVAGHNIANVNNEGYSRQRVNLEAQHPLKSRFGAGVDLQSVERLADGFVNKRLLSEQSRSGALELREQGLRRLEVVFNEVEGRGLRSALNAFWDSWGRLANHPEAEIYRAELITTAKELAKQIAEASADLGGVRRELNGRLAERVARVNQLSAQLAGQNTLVQRVERGAGEANDVRDAREATLNELARLVQIDWYEDNDHQVNVAVGNGWPLVSGRRANPLEASHQNEDAGMFSLRGIDAKGISRDLTGQLRSGELEELVRLRDETVVEFSTKLDKLASELAFKVNRLHATGTGLNSSTRALNSSFAFKPDALGKPVPFLTDGVFRVNLVGERNELLETYEVGIQAGKDTVGDIVKRINETVGDPKPFEAVLNKDGSVSLKSTGPQRIVLGEDETGFATVMGFNNFFESLRGAKDFRVSPRLVENPNLISTGKGLLPGDNQVALAIQGLQFRPTMDNDSTTFDEYYNGVMVQLGLLVQRSRADRQSQQLTQDQFRKLRDEISSVNMDEEVADLVQYQRGFDAAAKFIRTVDEMTKTVIDM